MKLSLTQRVNVGGLVEEELEGVVRDAVEQRLQVDANVQHRVARNLVQ